MIGVASSSSYSSSSSSSSIRHPRRTRASLPSRHVQSPLVARASLSSLSSLARSRSLAALAAWEADAIEPDVSSSQSSLYASVPDSASTDGGSSEHSARRLLGFRVSLPSRIHSRRRRKTFQYHVPVHLLAPLAPSASSRRQLSARPTTRPSSHNISGAMGVASAPTSPPFQVHTHATTDTQRRASAAPRTTPCSAEDGGHATRWRVSSTASHRGTTSFVSATHTPTPWHNPTNNRHSALLELSDHEESYDLPPLASDPRPSSFSSAFSSVSSSSALPSPALASRRHRAWSSLKAHARLPLPRGFKTRQQTPHKANAMFSISFYPWKMEAHGYYSTPEAAVAWVPDTASPRCQLCVASFTIARRRHHCRLCGKLVCNECSLPRTFLPIAEDALRREAHRSLIKSGAPQRTCDACATTLAKMVAQHDHRVKAVCVASDHSRALASTSACASAPSSRASLVGNASAERQLTHARPRGLSKTSVIRNDELDQVLRARAKSRSTSSSSTTDRTRQHIISSVWLEQWLQFVQMDSSDAVSNSTNGYGNQHAQQAARSSMMSSRSSMGSRRRLSSRFALGRRPGPICNYELLDFVNGTLVPRDALRRSRGTEGTGDYHVISHDVWHVFVRLYGGGPCITIDGDASPPLSTTHKMLTAPLDGDFAGFSPPPPQWIITELPDDEEETDNFPNAPEGSSLERPSRVQPAPMLPTPATAPPPQPQPLALRSTTTYELETGKSSAKRPASATMISTASPPPHIIRSTTGEMLAQDPHARRKSLNFIGYVKKWRHGDSDAAASRPSGASTTISQLDDDGVVLYDPAKLVHPQRAIEDDYDAVGHGATHPQRETFAAVSAFAAAAAEARRKSTMSLMRHHTTREPSQSGTVTA